MTTTITPDKPKTKRQAPAIIKVDNGIIPGYDPKADSAGYFFDDKIADMHCEFFAECLTHVKGELAGEPFIPEPWERAIIRNAFGWVDLDGLRRYRTVLILVPRKNGKSTLSAGLVTDLFFLDDEPGGEYYSAAGDRAQARIIFEMVRDMILNESELSSRCRILHNSITIEEVGKSYKPLSAEAKTKHGFNPQVVAFDELHTQPNRDLVDALETAMGARRQPITFYITTMDFDRPSICNEIIDYGYKVRDGTLENPDPTFLPVIYEAKIEEDWKSKKLWIRVNPNYGVSLKPEYMERAFKKANEITSSESTFKRLHLNMRTQTSIAWLKAEEWDACYDPEVVEPGLGTRCFSGLDLSHRSDMTAWCLYFPDLGGLARWHFWCPEDHPEAVEGGLYETWIRQGWISTTPGNDIDYSFIRAVINQVSPRYAMEPIAIDPWNARQLTLQLQDEDGIPMIEFRQGWASMSEPAKQLEGIVKSGLLNHENNPVARWMAMNAMVKTDPAGNIKPDKESSKNKIDGIVALTMAIGRYIVTPDDTGSVYEERGFIVL